MTFTVGLPDGARDYEFEGYVRLLEMYGVDIASTSRVVDPATGKRWLHAWKCEADAQAFAAAVRDETDNENWKVYSVPDEDVTPGPLGPIEILVSRRSDGCAYSLGLTSGKLVLKSFPRTNIVPSLFLTTFTQFDFETTHRAIWDQVAVILTGLSKMQIEQLGGYRVIDPVAGLVFREPPPGSTVGATVQKHSETSGGGSRIDPTTSRTDVAPSSSRAAG